MSALPEHLQGLLNPRAYPHPVQAVHLVETHISWILFEAPPEVLRARVGARRQRGDDPSDADLSVLHWQEMHCEPVQAEELFVLIEAVTDRSDVVNTLTRQIGALTV